MTENAPHDPEIRRHEVPEGARPTTNEPLNAGPRPTVTPALITALLVVVAVVVILALTVL